MNAIVSPTNVSISATMLEQRGNQFFLASTFPLLHLFNFFQHLGGKKRRTIDHRKAKKRINVNLARMNRGA